MRSHRPTGCPGSGARTSTGPRAPLSSSTSRPGRADVGRARGCDGVARRRAAPRAHRGRLESRPSRGRRGHRAREASRGIATRVASRFRCTAARTRARSSLGATARSRHRAGVRCSAARSRRGARCSSCPIALWEGKLAPSTRVAGPAEPRAAMGSRRPGRVLLLARAPSVARRLPRRGAGPRRLHARARCSIAALARARSSTGPGPAPRRAAATTRPSSTPSRARCRARAFRFDPAESLVRAEALKGALTQRRGLGLGALGLISARRRAIARECSCETRGSLTPRRAAMSLNAVPRSSTTRRCSPRARAGGPRPARGPPAP